MRILLLAVDFPPDRGGIQNLLANLAAGLARSHDVVVTAPAAIGSAERDAQCGYRVARVRRARLWPLVMLVFAVAGFVRGCRRRPDVVVCGHVLLGPVCWSLAKVFRAPLVVLAYAYEIRAPRMRRLAGWTLRRAAVVVSISEFTRRAVLAHGVLPGRIAVLHPGAASRPAREERGAVPDAPGRVILTVGRLGELYKGHDMVIRSMPVILSREPAARYVIVGDGPLRRYLERLAASVGVAHAVTFAGEVPDAVLDGWYRRADVFALLSRESPADGGAEGYGLAFVEAGAWMKPVVGGRSGGIPDAVIDGVTGVLVDPTDLGAISDAILRILADPDLARRLGAQGRHRALTELSWPVFVAGFERALQEALARAPAVRAMDSAHP